MLLAAEMDQMVVVTLYEEKTPLRLVMQEGYHRYDSERPEICQYVEQGHED